MKNTERTKITVTTTVQRPAEKVWKLWTAPEYITKWNFASDDWQCPEAENDLRPSGTFRSRMEAKDGSMGFDFSGVYDEVTPYTLIVYTIDDGRRVKVLFSEQNGETNVTETFEAEDTHTLDQQKEGWQSILDNFKNYAETI